MQILIVVWLISLPSRRFVRGTRGTADDDSNANNDRYATTKGDNAADNYVGGVIGTQENRTGDRWTLEKCINIGTVFNSRSNNAGGVLAYWLSYGGTLTNCYNFGEITTNANNGRKLRHRWRRGRLLQ